MITIAGQPTDDSMKKDLSYSEIYIQGRTAAELDQKQKEMELAKAQMQQMMIQLQAAGQQQQQQQQIIEQKAQEVQQGASENEQMKQAIAIQIARLQGAQEQPPTGMQEQPQQYYAPPM
jgi:hypothetical protein